MSLWDSLRTPLLSNDAWIEMSQTINAGLARINAANVIDAVTASATRLVEGITGTDAFQNALSVSREALGNLPDSLFDLAVPGLPAVISPELLTRSIDQDEPPPGFRLSCFFGREDRLHLFWSDQRGRNTLGGTKTGCFPREANACLFI